MSTSPNANRPLRRLRAWAAVAIIGLLASSSWMVLRADIPQVSSGTWLAAGEVGAVPPGAASVSLADGRLLVSGGTSEGVPVSGIGAFEPASGTWAAAGTMLVARSGHAATVLEDGRVLFAGGTAADGPSFDIEIYDPATGSSSHAGDMTLARVDAAAATLADGRVLIVGGSSGQGAVALAEIFDPKTGQSVAVAATMSTARTKATATTLLDGHVLVVGGSDGTNDLASAEIFDATAQSFFVTGAMQTPRSGHMAVLLPDNNQVLIAGGNSAATVVASAELYADWRDGFSPAPNPMSAPRSGGIAGRLVDHDLAFVGGGGATTGEYFGYATVKTDRADYWPGEFVTVTGSGWQPGETVTLTISEDADTHYDFTYTAVADASGLITNAEFAPIENEVFHHFGKKFYVAARGAASEALNTFTDGNATILGTVRNSVTNVVIAGATISCSTTGLTPCTNNPAAATSAADGTYKLDFNFSGNNTTANFTAVAVGYATQTQTLTFTSNNQTRTIDWLLVPSITPTTLTVGLATGTYGGNTAAALTATLTAGGTGVSGKSIGFTLNGTSVGSATTNASGVATLAAPSSLVGINAGTYPTGAAASFAGDASYSAQTASNVLTVNKAQLSVTADNKSKAYDGAVFTAFTATISGFVAGQTETALRGSGALMGAAAYSGAGTTAVTANATPYVVMPTLGSLTATNYTFAFVAGGLTINGRAATVTANAKSKTYGAANPTLDATVVGVVSGDTLNYSLATTATTTSGVGSFPITVTLGSNPNYTVTKTDAALTVTPAVATVTANAKSKTYGAANPALDAAVVGAVNGDTLDYSLATTATATSGVGSFPITVTLGSNPNYTVTKTDAALTVTPAVATVTANAKSKTYGAANPALDAAVVGAVNGDTLDYSLATTATTTSGVGSFPITVTLGSNPNYTVTKTDAALTVTPAVATVTANAKSKTYGAANPALDAAVVGAVNGDTLDYSLATTATTTSGVGSFPITVTLGSNPNYTVTKTDAALTVTPAVATVTANAKSKTYGAANPALDAAVVGAVNGDTLDYSLATTATTTSGVGSFPITVTLGSNPNYTVTKTDAALTVTPAVATVTANAKSKTYGAANPALDAAVVGAVNGDTLDYSLATTATTTSGVGSFPITVTLGSNPNYTVTKTDAALTVTPAVATVTANAKSKTYGAANPALDAAVVGAVNGDTLDYSLATTATTTSGVGSFPITVTLGSNPNYTVTKTDAALTVTPAVATVTANAKSKTYGAANPALDAAVVGAVNGDTLDYSLATTATTTSGVGSFPITVTLGSNPNYTVTKTDAALTVTPAVATVTANAKSRFYGVANPDLDAVVTGQVAGGDAVAYSLATTATTTSGIGSYPIAVTLGANPNYDVTFTNSTLTVNKAVATVTANAKSRFYGVANPDLDAVVTGQVAGGDAVAYSLATTATTTSGIGSYPIAVTLGANPNYTVSKTDAALTVNPAAATVTANAKSKFYGDANPALDATVTGTANGDVLNYSLATAADATSGVGTYAVTVTLGTNPNYTVTPSNGTLTVGARAATVTANAKSKFYGDANPALDATVTGTANGDVLNYTLATAADATSGVGSYAVTVTLGTNPNYTVTPSNGTLTVGARAATVTANAKSKFYGDANPALDATVTGTANGDVLAYSLATAADATSGVGTYAVTVTLGTNPNYTVTPSNGTLTVGARAATVTANAKSKFYGDANPALDATVTGTANGDVLAYSLATAADATSGVGTYAVTVTLGTNPNYTVTPSNGTLTVGARAATVTANAKSKFYGDANPALDATVTGTVNGDVLAYSLATAADATSGVGTYAVTVTLGSNPNYTVTPSNGMLTVGARTATVTANAKSKTYGAANPALDAVVGGAVNGDTLNFSLATTATTTSGVGSYPIAVTLGSNPNYSVTSTNASLTVTQATATVTANAKGKSYGAANPALDAVVGGAVNGDTLNYSLATTATTTSGVGSYPIAVTLGSNPNYSVTPTNASLTVTQATATVTANAKGKSYGAANPALDAVVTGQVAGGDAVAYSLATTATTTSGIGSYPIAVTLGSNPNYSVTPTNASLTVTQATATVTANAKSKTYGAANPALDAVVGGAVNGDTLNYSLATTATTTSGVGSYPIAVTLGSNPNYSVTPTNASLTVTQATATVTANAKSKTYGAANPALNAMVVGAVNGDTLNFSLATTATTTSGVGSYPIAVTLGTNPNYTVTKTDSTLTILYRWDGFLQPINDTAHDLETMSRFKAGQTIPAKFDIKDVNGVVVQQTGSPLFNYGLIGACTIAEADTLDAAYQPSTQSVYTLSGGHYQYNWSTKGLAAGLYRIFAKLSDGTTQTVDICLSK